MKFARWEELTSEQRRHVHSLRRDWKPSDFILFEYKINKDGSLSRKKGDHQPTPEYKAALYKALCGEDIRSKGDNREWRPGHSFTFIRD